MKTILLLTIGLMAFNRVIAADCCEPPAETAGATPVVSVAGKTAEAAPVRHALKGVVIDVLAGKSALLVKHEEIPGVMKGMTMLLTVDAATLKSDAARKGAVITGSLVHKADGWWLEGVAVSSQPVQ